MAFKSATLAANFALATEDFTQFTANSADLSGLYYYENLIKASLVGSIMPISKLYINASGSLLFNLVSTSSNFAAVQWQGYIQYQFFSDLMVSLSIGQEIPMNNVGINYLTGTFGFVLSF